MTGSDPGNLADADPPGNPDTVSLKTCLMTGSDPGNVAYADPAGNPKTVSLKNLFGDRQ
jgi:hypothetical protein